MPVIFSYRSDTITARYAAISRETSLFGVTATTTAIGGFQAQLGASGNLKAIANENWVSTTAYSMLLRINPDTNTMGGVDWGMFEAGSIINNDLGSTQLYLNSSKQFFYRDIGPDGLNICNTSTSQTWEFTTSAWYDFLIVFRDTATGAAEIFIDGSTFGSINSTFKYSFVGNQRNNLLTQAFSVGRGTISNISRFHLNEMVVWNEIIDPTNITLVDPSSDITSTGQSLNGNSRTGWVDVAKFWGLESTDPGIANVLSNTAYTINGVSLTGTYHDLVSVDPGVANVKEGTGYTINDSSLTGTLSIPTPVDGTAGTVNIPNIKEQIRFILDDNNTTTSSVLDLSSGLSKRVLQVAKINPENLPIQSTKFPAVTVHTSKKTIESRTIAKNQVDGKRRSVLTFTVTGMVWNQNFQSNIFNDPADQDLEALMENIERILRSYHDLNSNVTWQVASDVTYHNAAFDEQTHFRVGFLDIEATVYY